MVPPRDRVARTSGISRQSCVVTGACCAVCETRQSAILVLSPALDAGSSSAAAQQAIARITQVLARIRSCVATGGGHRSELVPLADVHYTFDATPVLPLFSKGIKETFRNEQS